MPPRQEWIAVGPTAHLAKATQNPTIPIQIKHMIKMKYDLLSYQIKLLCLFMLIAIPTAAASQHSVSAPDLPTDNTKDTAGTKTVNVDEGWNLVNSFDYSTIDLDRPANDKDPIRAAFRLDAEEQEFDRVSRLSEIGEAPTGQGLWVYADHPFTANYNRTTESRRMYRGWNIVGDVTDMNTASQTRSLNALAGAGCKIDQAYYWNTDKNEYQSVSKNESLQPIQGAGNALLVHTLQDCQLGGLSPSTEVNTCQISGGFECSKPKLTVSAQTNNQKDYKGSQLKINLTNSGRQTRTITQLNLTTPEQQLSWNRDERLILEPKESTTIMWGSPLDNLRKSPDSSFMVDMNGIAYVTGAGEDYAKTITGQIRTQVQTSSFSNLADFSVNPSSPRPGERTELRAHEVNVNPNTRTRTEKISWFIDGERINTSSPYTSYTFPSKGIYDVTLRITTKDKTILEQTKQINVSSRAEKAKYAGWSEDDPVLGRSSAPITVYFFHDLGGPFDARWAQNNVDTLQREYISDGDLRLIFKDYPQPQLHPNARQAHSAANCVYKDQGIDEYQEFISEVFSDQRGLEEASPVDSYLSGKANDQSTIRNCDLERDRDISEDRSEADEIEIQGTPSFLLVNKDGDTQRVRGAQNYREFERAIQELLGDLDQNNRTNSSTSWGVDITYDGNNIAEESSPGEDDKPVSFSAEPSDSAPSQLAYDWTFELDKYAGVTTSKTGKNVEEAFTQPGVYNISVRAEADSGQTAQSHLKYLVTRDGRPFNMFVDNDEVNNPPTDEEVSFIASEAQHGPVESFTWTLYSETADGEEEVFTSGETDSPSTQYTFDEEGDFRMNLMLTYEGEKGSLARGTPYFNREFNVTENNRPPSAIIQHSPSKPSAGEQVEFNARQSDDPDGNIERYQWHTDGSIIPSGVTTTKTYDEPGKYTVSLKVTDDDGATGRTTKQIEVEPQQSEDQHLGKVSFWCGKVNQHTEDGEWTTDPDGRSGCQETILGYCQDMYPESEYAYQAGPRRIDTWRAAGNQGEYSASKPAYHCVSYQVDHDESDYDVSLLSIDQRVAPGDYNASVGSDNVALEEGDTTLKDGYNVTVTEVGKNSVRVQFGAEDKIVPKYHGTTFDVGGSRYKVSLLRTGR